MLKAAIGFGEFEVTLPMDDILDMSLRREAGEHSRFRIRGITTKDAAEKTAERFDGSQSVSLFLKDENGGKRLRFSGIVTKLAVHRGADVCETEAEALGHTFSLDTERRFRSFQDAGMTYGALVKAVTDAYGDADFILNGDDEPIGDMLVQYDETDFEFLKRAAGKISRKLIPLDGYDGVRFFVGLGEKRKATKIGSDKLTIRKDIGAFMRESKNGGTETELSGMLRYDLHTDKWLDTGDPVKADGKTLYVLSGESSLENGLFLHTYTLCDASGFSEPRTFNERLAGVTLFGIVTEVSKDKIALKLDIDAKNPNCGSRLFPYSTVYSSPDGSGWYFMPEKGDRVSLHFPSAAEKDAYARSSADLRSANPQRRSNPDDKTIYTKHGKEIRLTPGSVEIYSGNRLWLRLYENGGVEIHSAKDISVSAGGNLNLSGGRSIRVSGSEIEFSQGSGEFAMRGDNVVAVGEEVKVGE
jgi:hypothetical protein